jgi:hypothetical protein
MLSLTIGCTTIGIVMLFNVNSALSGYVSDMKIVNVGIAQPGHSALIFSPVPHTVRKPLSIYIATEPPAVSMRGQSHLLNVAHQVLEVEFKLFTLYLLI